MSILTLPVHTYVDPPLGIADYERIVTAKRAALNRPVQPDGPSRDDEERARAYEAYGDELAAAYADVLAMPAQLRSTPAAEFVRRYEEYSAEQGRAAAVRAECGLAVGDVAGVGHKLDDMTDRQVIVRGLRVAV